MVANVLSKGRLLAAKNKYTKRNYTLLFYCMFAHHWPDNAFVSFGFIAQINLLGIKTGGLYVQTCALSLSPEAKKSNPDAHS
jgi:hypothetical protein